MGKANNENMKKARELRANGLTLYEVAKQVGIPYGTAQRYCFDPNRQYGEGEKAKYKMTFAQQYEWTVAVNRIRKYYNKKQFPLPEFPNYNWEKHYEQITTQTS